MLYHPSLSNECLLVSTLCDRNVSSLGYDTFNFDGPTSIFVIVQTDLGLQGRLIIEELLSRPFLTFSCVSKRKSRIM